MIRFIMTSSGYLVYYMFLLVCMFVPGPHGDQVCSQCLFAPYDDVPESYSPKSSTAGAENTIQAWHGTTLYREHEQCNQLPAGT